MSDRREYPLRGPLWEVGVVGAMLCAASCAEPKTIIVARIESDLRPCAELQSVGLRAQWENGPVLGEIIGPGQALDVCDAAVRPPGEIGVVPRDPADSRKVVIFVTGTARAADGTTYTLRQEFVTRFQQGRTVYVSFSLARVCASNPCPSGYSCVPGPAGEARCASREEPVVFTREQAAGRDAAVWSDALAVDAVPSGDVLADVATEEVGADAPAVDTQVSDDVMDGFSEERELLTDAAVDVTVADTQSDVSEFDHLDTSDELAATTDGRSFDVFDAGDDIDETAVLDSSNDVRRDVGPDAASDADASAEDVSAPSRCPSGVRLAGSRPMQRSPWSASNVGTTTPLLRWSAPMPSPVCIEICSDRACSIVDQVINVPMGDAGVTPSATVPVPLRAGVHFWRLSAYIASVFPAEWSPFSPTWEFFVARNATPRPSGQATVWSIVPDFNGDGLADGIAPMGDSSGLTGIAYLQSRRSVGLSAPGSIPIRDPFSSTSIGDIDGDGFVDLVVMYSRDARPNIGYLPGGPAGLAREGVGWSTIHVGNYTCVDGACNCKVVGDLNDDGFVDALCNNLRGSPTERYALITYGNSSRSTAVGDVSIRDSFASGVIPDAFVGMFDANRDGVGDLAIYRGGRLAIIHGGTGFSSRSIVEAASFPMSDTVLLGVAGDFNGDGSVDLLNSVYRGGTQVILGPLSSGAPRVVAIDTPAFAERVSSPIESAIDVNGDGLSDVLRGDPAFSSFVTGGGQVRVILGARDGAGGLPPVVAILPTMALAYPGIVPNFNLGWIVIPLGDTGVPPNPGQGCHSISGGVGFRFRRRPRPWIRRFSQRSSTRSSGGLQPKRRSAAVLPSGRRTT